MRKYFWIFILVCCPQYSVWFYENKGKRKETILFPIEFSSLFSGQTSTWQFNLSFLIVICQGCQNHRKYRCFFPQGFLSSFSSFVCFCLFLITSSNRKRKQIKINITINENISSSHGIIVYKIAFLHSHKIKYIVNLKHTFFTWNHMTDYDLLFIFVSERHFNLQEELLQRNF